MLKLVLFINGQDMYESFDYPLKGDENLDPRPAYVSYYGLDKTEDFPNNYPSLDSFTHEWKLMYKEDE